MSDILSEMTRRGQTLQGGPSYFCGETRGSEDIDPPSYARL